MKLNGPIKPIADTQKKVGDIQKKLAQKEKEIAAAEKTYHNEETKVNKKAADAEKKRIQEASRQSAALEQAIHRQEQLQFQMRQEIDEMKALPEKSQFFSWRLILKVRLS